MSRKRNKKAMKKVYEMRLLKLSFREIARVMRKDVKTIYTWYNWYNEENKKQSCG